MHSGPFLQDLAVVMIVAGLVTVLFHRLKQPVVLGYIIAGLIIGPHTPPYALIADEATINTLSELGVVLLLFSLGLEFNLRKLREVGLAALIAAVLEILLMVWAGFELGRAFGWSTMDSLFLGAILSISSTTIIVKALGELGKAREPFAQLIFGILVIEDLLAIAMIALLSGIATTGSLQAADVGLTLARLGIFLTVVLVAGLLAVPRLLATVARFKSNEMLLVTVLGLCFGFALLAAKLGYSIALGAFLAGAVIAESREHRRIETLIEPVRDMFSAIFFVTIGLLIDPKVLLEHWIPVAVITLAVVAGKVASCSFGTFIGGNDRRTSLRVGMGLAQIGEFSFIIAALGLSLKVTSPFLYPIAVAVSAITTLLTPYLIQASDAVVTRFDRLAPRALTDTLELYTRWVGQLGSRHQLSHGGKLVRRWTLQMGVNTTLMAGVFLAAAYLGRRPPGWTRALGLPPDILDAALWLGAVVLSLPLFIATLGKLRALGLLVAQTRVTPGAAGEAARAIRALVAPVIPFAGTTALALLLLALSSAILPNPTLLILLLGVAVLIAWLFWRSFVRVYSRAQFALQQTLASPPPPPPAPPDHDERPLPALLREAALETVTLGPDSPAHGRRIRELALRTHTGASIIGISRTGTSLVNPGPDEELLPGDQVLLLGTRDQLRTARDRLLPRP